jgi:hypothetical protein
MCQTFPESWDLVLHEWQTNALGDFEQKGTKGAWDNGLQQRYAKRIRAMKVLKKMAGKKPLKHMANDFDLARVQQNNMSMTNHIDMLYKNQFAYKSRARGQTKNC